MNLTNHEKLAANLEAGRVYRRGMLASLTTDVDRDLATLVSKGMLEKVGPGLYHKPAQSRYGLLPTDDKDLISNFLKDDRFLIYSWNVYNSLGLGLTQLYNRYIVYNCKRHGLFVLDNKQFDFRRPARGFPEKLSREFLVVDLINNLTELAEDAARVKASVKKRLSNFDLEKLYDFVKLYGKVATRKFFRGLNNEKNISS